ncbi:MAG TPA: DUF748 domain-containing protein [Dissulfurispiraceae bacterium]|nr:DUF748 domain-containing protein [Dissulfurispiraceae bacterium]
MTKRLKRILTATAIVVCIICIALIFLIRNANEVLKAQLEGFLGKDFHVDRIELNWGNVDAYGVHLTKDGQDILRVDRLRIKADFMGFVKKYYSISSITVEKPFILVSVDKQGKLMLPLMSSKGRADKPDKSDGNIAVDVSNLVIVDGELHLVDERMPAKYNRIDMTGLNLRVDNLKYPLADNFSKFNLTAMSAGRIVSGSFSADGKINLKTVDADMSFDGKNITLLDAEGAGPMLKTDSMKFRLFLHDSQEGMVYTFDDAVIKRPVIRYETDTKGDLASPWGEIINGITNLAAKRT